MPLGGGDAVPLTALPGDECEPTLVARRKGDRVLRGRPQLSGQLPDHGDVRGGRPAFRSHQQPRMSTTTPLGRRAGSRSPSISNRTGSTRLWLVSRDSVGGAWHEAVQLTDFACSVSDVGAGRQRCAVQRREGPGLRLASGARALAPQPRAASRLRLIGRCAVLPRRPNDLREPATHEDGRQGVWAIPAAGGTPRLVVAFDDQALASLRTLQRRPDRLYLTVSQYESDIWVAKLQW